MRDIRQTKHYAEYLSRIGWGIERVGESYAFIKKLPLIGGVMKIQRPEKLRNKEIEKIKNLRKKYGVFQTIIEPKNTIHHSRAITIVSGDTRPFTIHGFRQSQNPYLPSKTLCLDLTQSKNDLYNQMKKDARYCLRKTKNLRICSIDKIDKFHTSWKEAVGFKKHKPSKKELDTMLYAFKNNCQFITTPDGSAGAIFLKTKNRAYYWQAFASSKGRAELAQYKIVWAAILWAKKKRAKIFDFEGIYDKRFPNKSWLGFTHFKKSFGGYEVEYPGAFIKTQFPFK